MHHFNLQVYKMSNDFSFNVVIHKWICFLNSKYVFEFLKILKNIIIFLYVTYPRRIRILGFQKTGGSVSESVSVSVSVSESW